jgi:hypothetical protein
MGGQLAWRRELKIADGFAEKEASNLVCGKHLILDAGYARNAFN